MNKFRPFIAVAIFALSFTACKNDNDEPTVELPPSDGSTLTLNGLVGAEIGSSAGNSVYVDFSKDKASAVERDSWDLGFYTGADFKVILNSSNGASAILTTVAKTDLATVTAADFDPNTLKVGQGGGNFTIIDDSREASILSKTAIATVSATDSENKVYIVNRKGGSNTVLPTEELYKIRIIRKGAGYTLQYAKVNETLINTLDVVKNAELNFQFVSLVKRSSAVVEPVKAEWDLVWGYSMYWTASGTAQLPYGFSDLVFINQLGGVSAAPVTVTATKTYASFTEADLSAVTFSTNRDVIGSTWRNTTGAAIGVRADIFYVVKDAAENIYKLKFNSFISNDGGTRGKPVIEYKLVKKA